MPMNLITTFYETITTICAQEMKLISLDFARKVLLLMLMICPLVGTTTETTTTIGKQVLDVISTSAPSRPRLD